MAHTHDIRRRLATLLLGVVLVFVMTPVALAIDCGSSCESGTAAHSMCSTLCPCCQSGNCADEISEVESLEEPELMSTPAAASFESVVVEANPMAVPPLASAADAVAGITVTPPVDPLGTRLLI